ncbi:O-antigen ligase family protein [Synechococcus sp. BDU 130192]|uniref:O-antigen ligase family protein n=1 Tax=Synechococcus sp. BDU 130192 TaxID=2042059 RepID=UPI000C071E75|nr:O-antigen ligase family protein [Synechococcus sp. BDU 130192]
MGSAFLSQFINLLSSPLGMVCAVIGVILAYQARRSPRMAWLLVALCCFAASLSEFRDQYVLDPPDLVFPLEQLRAAGRPLSLLLVGLLLWLGVETPNKQSWRQRFMPSAVWCLMAIQGLIFFKTFASGSLSFALLAFMTFASTVLMVWLGPSRWLQDDGQFYLAIWAIASVGVLFVIANGYQAFFDLYPITFVHGALLGTTGNPQHAATLLATTVPCLLFLMQAQRQQRQQIFWVIALVLVLIALFLTASRTGALMGCLAVLLFFRRGKNQFIRVAFFIGLFVAVLVPILSTLDTNSVANQLLDTELENSRLRVWRAMWNAFSAHPFFGAPLQSDRLGYGENSWLAIAANLGIVGLIPLFFFGVSCIRLILKLDQIATRSPMYSLHSNTIIAGLAALLVGSIFEAFLLGTITFPSLALLLYLSLGQYLIELHQAMNSRLPSGEAPGSYYPEQLYPNI